MSISRLTLMGLLTYDENLLKNNFHLPQQLEDMEDEFFNYLVFECAELEISVPDPEWLGKCIYAWSIVMRPQWEYFGKWQKAQNEANEENAQGRKNVQTKYQRKPNLTNTTTGSNTEDVQNEGTSKVNAYNSTDLFPDSAFDNYTNTSQSTSGKTALSGTDESTSVVTESYAPSLEYLHNIINAGYENLALQVVDDFKERFCLMVY